MENVVTAIAKGERRTLYNQYGYEHLKPIFPPLLPITILYKSHKHSAGQRPGLDGFPWHIAPFQCGVSRLGRGRLWMQLFHPAFLKTGLEESEAMYIS